MDGSDQSAASGTITQAAGSRQRPLLPGKVTSNSCDGGMNTSICLHLGGAADRTGEWGIYKGGVGGAAPPVKWPQGD